MYANRFIKTIDGYDKPESISCVRVLLEPAYVETLKAILREFPDEHQGFLEKAIAGARPYRRRYDGDPEMPEGSVSFVLYPKDQVEMIVLMTVNAIGLKTLHEAQAGMLDRLYGKLDEYKHTVDVLRTLIGEYEARCPELAAILKRDGD